MEPKFTPGPWQVNDTDLSQVCDCDGEVRGCAPIAFCTFGTNAERKANARLIAAAPEMYEALSALHAVQNGPPLPKYTADWEAAMRATEAALAKAEGR